MALGLLGARSEIQTRREAITQQPQPCHSGTGDTRGQTRNTNTQGGLQPTVPSHSGTGAGSETQTHRPGTQQPQGLPPWCWGCWGPDWRKKTRREAGTQQPQVPRLRRWACFGGWGAAETQTRKKPVKREINYHYSISLPTRSENWPWFI